jgi:hypothetical protein
VKELLRLRVIVKEPPLLTEEAPLMLVENSAALTREPIGAASNNKTQRDADILLNHFFLCLLFMFTSYATDPQDVCV